MQQRAEHKGAHHHTKEQHHVEECHHARPRFFRGKVVGQSKTSCLRRVDARSDQQEGQGRSDFTPHGRAVAVARQHQQREGQDGEAAELHHSAEPDIGYTPPAQHRLVGIRLEADQRAERRDENGDRYHQPDQPSRHVKFDDHDAVQRAGEKHQRHADRNLEQGQPQESRQGKVPCRGIGEGQESRTDLLQRRYELAVDANHMRFSSCAWEM